VLLTALGGITGAGLYAVILRAARAAGATTITVPSRTSNPGNADSWLAAGSLLFGVLAIAVVVIFLRKDRSESLGITRDLGAAGLDVESISVEASEQAGAAGAVAVAAQSAPVTLHGPSTVVVGKPAVYTVERGGSPAEATVKVDPPDVAKSNAPIDKEVSHASVTASRAGVFGVTATADNRTAELHVTAVAASSQRIGVPSLGAGWGSVVVAITVASITATLGAIGAIDGQAIATILGGLVGYVVARSTHSDAQGSRSGRPAAPHDAAH
jgi:hypothetical protein